RRPGADRSISPRPEPALLAGRFRLGARVRRGGRRREEAGEVRREEDVRPGPPPRRVRAPRGRRGGRTHTARHAGPPPPIPGGPAPGAQSLQTAPAPPPRHTLPDPLAILIRLPAFRQGLGATRVPGGRGARG